jgi:hypothetical protein
MDWLICTCLQPLNGSLTSQGAGGSRYGVALGPGLFFSPLLCGQGTYVCCKGFLVTRRNP